MKIFSESGLLFEFPEHWKILKYDEHRFYGYLSGSGFKGVDFIGIVNQEQLALIEVKNYNDRFSSDASKPTDLIFAAPDALAEHYSRKFRDSFQLIDIIRSYYERRWWYRRMRPLLLKAIPKKLLLRTDWGFWNYVIQLIQEKNMNINLILWLELPSELSTKQKADFHTLIYHRLLPDFPPPKFNIYMLDSRQSKFDFKGTLQ